MENNEFFSMLLNFDNNSFQSVPDILRTNPLLNNPTHDVILGRGTPSKLQQYTPEFNEHSSLPLDMQFPNGLRSPDKAKVPEEPTPSKSTPSSSQSSTETTRGSKKRKKASTALESEQSVKAHKQSVTSSPAISQLDDEDDLDNSDTEESSKRKRRLVKNREAAQMFRQRQKAYIQNLEKKVNDMNFESQQHRSKIELLTTENRLLSDQLNYLRTFISGVISMTIPGQIQHHLPVNNPQSIHNIAQTNTHNHLILSNPLDTSRGYTPNSRSYSLYPPTNEKN